MNITLMAHDKKKELMVQFCTAYKSVLSKHNLSATATTGRLVAEATGLPVTLYLSHNQGQYLLGSLPFRAALALPIPYVISVALPPSSILKRVFLTSLAITRQSSLSRMRINSPILFMR